MSWTREELVARDRAHLIHPLHHPSDHLDPIIWARGRGAVGYDVDGREFIDGLSGLWNVNIGHGREELAEVAAAQMRELAFCSSYVGASNMPAITLAERLVGLAANGLEAVFFTSGGAEANETAFKTARFYWKASGRPDKVKLIARSQAYHGLTLQTMSATGMGAGYWNPFEPRVPGFVHVQYPHAYRFQGARPGETVGQAAAREIEEAILREGPETVAAVVGEPIQGAGGVFYPTDDYWPLVREVCTRHDVLLIADEVITGFCRTGRWFALDHWQVRPDIMTFAKGVTSGYLPLGGMMVSRAIRDSIDAVPPDRRWAHAFTYSAHPTCCAVALRNLEIMERERLWENAAAMGTRLHQGLVGALGDHPNVGDVRGGLGLMAALEFVEDKTTKANFAGDRKVANRLQAEMVKRGVVTRVRPVAGPHPAPGDAVFFAPPLVVTPTQIDTIVDAAREAARAVFGS
jgi:adenosylmethionine-8-amino-7-oxononanoate aminotransferase